jgi:hypothetical protein
LADVNGDGKMDVVGFWNDGVYVALSTGGSFTGPQKWVNGFGLNDGWNVNDHPRMMADVNGDGKADVVGFSSSGVMVALSNGSGFTAPAQWVAHYGINQSWYSNHPRILADVNGDGKKDVVGFYYDGVYVSLSTGTGFTSMQKWVDGFGSNDGWDWNKPRFLADANGDGRDDVIGFGTDGVRVSLSTGTSFMISVLVVNNLGTDAGWGENFYPRTVADVNGDGKADVVGFGSYGVAVALSTSFAPLPTYTITATAGANGTISPSESVSVTKGENKTFSIAANSGYEVQSVTVDGNNQGAITSYPFTNVQADHTIAATFAPIPTYTITATAGANGTISPSGIVVAVQGNNKTFTITANSGYGVQSVTVDGVNQGAITSYTFTNVQTNHTIVASFAPLPTYYTITTTAGTGGTISPAGSVSVLQGANQTFTIAANSGYRVQSVTVDGVNQGVITSYPFTNIQTNHTIAATFAFSPIVPLGAIVPFDSDATIPSGWTQFNPANDRYLVGAGGTYAVGATGGGGTISIDSTINGEHTGNNSWTGMGDGWDSVRAEGGPAGGHAHNINCTPTLGSRQMRFLKASAQQNTFPVNALVLATQNLSGLMNVYAGDNRYLGPGVSRNATHSSIGAASCSTAGAHEHTWWVGGCGEPDWSWADYPCFAAEGVRGDHSHTVAVSLANDNVQKAYVTAWTNAAAAFGVSAGMIVMYESLTPPPGWVLCDGTNGTVDLRNYFVFLGPAGSQGTKSGNNTLALNDNIESFAWTHDHIYYCSWAAPVKSWDFQHGNGDFPHAHDLTNHNLAYQPPYYALVFIQKQ